MNALVNAHTRNDDNLSPCTGLISNVLPEAQRSQTGVSSEYVHKKEHHWFVLRVTYNRTQKACDIIANADVQTYMPMHYIIKKENGKKKRILQPLFPISFLYIPPERLQTPLSRKKTKIRLF